MDTMTLDDTLQALLILLRENLRHPDLTLPIPPTNKLIVSAFCLMTHFTDGVVRSKNGRSQKLFLEVSKKLFDLTPPDGHEFREPTRLCDAVLRLRKARKYGGTKWKRLKDAENSKVFFQPCTAVLEVCPLCGK